MADGVGYAQEPNLPLTTYDLQLTTYNLRLTTYNSTPLIDPHKMQLFQVCVIIVFQFDEVV